MLATISFCTAIHRMPEADSSVGSVSEESEVAVREDWGETAEGEMARPPGGWSRGMGVGARETGGTARGAERRVVQGLKATL